MPTTPANAINVTTTGAVSFNASTNTFTGSTLSVANGGTAATTFNTNGVVISNTSGTGALAALSLTSGQIVIGGTSTPAAASLTAGSGITITPGNNSITISAAGSGLTWTNQATSFSAAVSNGYFVTASATATLPASPSLGDTIEFVNAGSGTLVIQAGTGQVIQIGSAASTAAGTATTTATGASVTLVYNSTATTWWTDSLVGTWATA